MVMISFFGNNGDDTLDGGNGADYLNGGAGGDAMSGGDGDDIYIVDSTSDTVILKFLTRYRFNSIFC